jgi:hypothetical protein
VSNGIHPIPLSEGQAKSDLVNDGGVKQFLDTIQAPKALPSGRQRIRVVIVHKADDSEPELPVILELRSERHRSLVGANDKHIPLVVAARSKSLEKHTQEHSRRQGEQPLTWEEQDQKQPAYIRKSESE